MNKFEKIIKVPKICIIKMGKNTLSIFIYINETIS